MATTYCAWSGALKELFTEEEEVLEEEVEEEEQVWAVTCEEREQEDKEGEVAQCSPCWLWPIPAA